MEATIKNLKKLAEIVYKELDRNPLVAFETFKDLVTMMLKLEHKKSVNEISTFVFDSGTLISNTNFKEFSTDQKALDSVKKRIVESVAKILTLKDE